MLNVKLIVPEVVAAAVAVLDEDQAGRLSAALDPLEDAILMAKFCRYVKQRFKPVEPPKQ